MLKALNAPVLLVGFLSFFITFCSFAAEKDELALLLIQLNQMESTLDRAQSVSSQSRNERFYFDYRRARDDIKTIRNGINRYLEPSRAQPTTSTVIGRYQGENR